MKREYRIAYSLIGAALVGAIALGLPGPVPRALPQAAMDSTPANPNATPETAQVLAYLADLPNRPDNRVLSGQFSGFGQEVSGVVGGSSWYTRFVASLENSTGHHPALLTAGYNYWWGTLEQHNLHVDVNTVLIDHWNKGGLVGINFGIVNPWAPGDYGGGDTPLGDMDDLFTPGNAAYTKFHRQLDFVAGGLQDLENYGVVVMFRTFNEANITGHFWWSKITPAEYVRLWQYMFNYFTYEKGLDNVLYVYGPNALYYHWEPVMTRYPGDDYVDIVALDSYTNDVRLDGYEDLVATGKPVGVAEFGPWPTDGQYDYTRLINQIRAKYPRVCYFNPWAGDRNNELWSIASNRNGKALLEDPWVVNRDEVDWRSLPEPTPTPEPTSTPVPTATPVPLCEEVGSWNGTPIAVCTVDGVRCVVVEGVGVSCDWD